MFVGAANVGRKRDRLSVFLVGDASLAADVVRFVAAAETLGPLAKTPNGIYYGGLKLDPLWDPLRKDSRFDKLLDELAPRD